MRLLYALAGLSAAGLFFLFPILGLTHSSGAAAGFTGGPADNGTCQLCHSSFEVNSGTGSVDVDAPEAFIPGMTYEFIVSVDNTTEPQGDDPVQGFQLSVQDADGNHIGELLVTDTENTRFSAASTDYITHTTAGRLTATWTMSWTAPAAGDAPEQVTIYVAGNAAAGNSSPADDYIYTTTAQMTAKDTAIEPPTLPGVLVFEAVYPNPLRDRATVRLSANEAVPVALTVYDGLGRAIHVTDAGVVEPGERELALRLPDLPSGLYLIEVSTPQGALVRPVTVAR